MINFGFPDMNLKVSEVNFEAGLCTVCPIVVQTFFDKKFTAVLHIVDLEKVPAKVPDKSFILYRFELDDDNSYSSAPTVETINLQASFISNKTDRLKSLTPYHARLLLSKKPDHKWSKDSSASLLSFAGIDETTNSIYMMICRVDADFECEKIKTFDIPFYQVDPTFEKIKANQTHVMVTFSGHFISFWIEDRDDSIVEENLSVENSVSKITYYEGRFYGIYNDVQICRLKKAGNKLTTELFYEEINYNKKYVQLITSGRHLVAKFENQTAGGFNIISKMDEDFFNESEAKATLTDLIAARILLPKASIPKRYYEFQGKFMYATSDELSMRVVPPTVTPPKGKILKHQDSSRLNKSSSLVGERIVLSLPLQEGGNSFALLSELKARPQHSHEATKFLLNEVILSTAFLDFGKIPSLDLLEQKNFEFEAYYFENPNFRQVKYSIQFIESSMKPQSSLIWIFFSFALVFLVLFIVLCFKFRTAIKTSTSENLRPEDCSLMEPVLGAGSPMKFEKGKKVEDSDNSNH